MEEVKGLARREGGRGWKTGPVDREAKKEEKCGAGEWKDGSSEDDGKKKTKEK